MVYWNEKSNLKPPTDYSKTKTCCYCASSVTIKKVIYFKNGAFCSKKCVDKVIRFTKSKLVGGN